MHRSRLGALVIDCRTQDLHAAKIEKARDWWGPESPTGHRCCVVPADRPDLRDRAWAWEAG